MADPQTSPRRIDLACLGRLAGHGWCEWGQVPGHSRALGQEYRRRLQGYELDVGRHLLRRNRGHLCFERSFEEYPKEGKVDPEACKPSASYRRHGTI